MEDALENIELNSTGMFDPKLVAVFKELFEDGTLVRIQTTYSN
jgi:HD-GYP domain-containing protein (c-di-GMP phosphodiesterase class II)